jgi:hypothetical protein
MRQTKLLATLALATVLLAACGGQQEQKAAQPAAQSAPQAAPTQAEVAAPAPAAPTEAPKAAEPAAPQPAAEAPGAAKVVAKPIFIDFYAPW